MKVYRDGGDTSRETSKEVGEVGVNYVVPF
jgi:hypothetical protein